MAEYLDQFRDLHIPDRVNPKKSKKDSQRARLDIQRFFDTEIMTILKDMVERGLLDGPEYAGCFFDLNLEANGVLAVRPAIDNMSIFIPPNAKVHLP